MPTATPTLAELATIAHARRCAVVVTQSTRVLIAESPRSLPFLGVRFGPRVEAVAARLHPDPNRQTPTVALDRRGDAVVFDPFSGANDIVPPDTATLDPARRSLGLPTRPCRRPIWALVNAVWVERVLAATLAAPLGEPPRWLALSRLHPLRLLGPTASPELLAHHVRSLHTDWASLRGAAIDRSASWLPITPTLAAWFDSGSFARHCFAELPDLDMMLTDLDDLLAPGDIARVEAALATP